MREKLDWTFIAPGPATPSTGLYVLLAIAFALVAGQNIDWAYARFQPPAEGLRVVAIWVGLSLAANLAGFACVPIWRRISERFPTSRGGLRPWIAFYELVALTQLVLMVGRSLAGTVWLPGVFNLRAAVVAVLNNFLANMAIVLVCERNAAMVRDAIEHQTRLQGLSEELQQARAQMVSEDDRLRAEVARMLHGELQTLLLVSWVELGEAMTLREQDPTAYDRKIRQVEQRLRLASEILDSGLDSWLGAIESAGDLCLALEQLAKAFSPVLRVTLDLSPQLRGLGAALPPATTRATLRLVQEALLNALKHARVQEVQVIGESGPAGELTLRVEDDGRGFGADRARSVLGYSLLGKELEANGGYWSLSSTPGRGTRLMVRLAPAGIGA